MGGAASSARENTRSIARYRLLEEDGVRAVWVPPWTLGDRVDLLVQRGMELGDSVFVAKRFLVCSGSNVCERHN
jgi:hypothetical protein